MIRHLVCAAALVLAFPVLGQARAPAPPSAAPAVSAAPQAAVDAALAQAPRGTRFGLIVLDPAGRVVVAVNPDMRFIPASNTKLFTTAAALALLPQTALPDAAGGAQVYLVPGRKGRPADAVLVGRGDARMSSAADCVTDCLAALADAVAARTRTVNDVIGDDSLFPDQRWSAGMSWNNIGDYNATAASALSLDANELAVRVSPGPAGGPPRVDAPPYLLIQNDARTGPAGSATTLDYDHPVNSRVIRLRGTIAADAPEWRTRVGIDDPADYAAATFAALLRARGVAVRGAVRTRHQPVAGKGEQAAAAAAQAARLGALGPPLAALTPPPLADMAALVNKPSQNHHAEQLLRRIGRLGGGSGSVEDGLAAERALFLAAGVPASGFDLFDGSGMSTYNRVSPRAVGALLRWGLDQPWGPVWLASFPVAGQDGTLKRRFAGTVLDRRIRAKTGTLNATNALSGVLTAASGRRYVFAFLANDVPEGASALPAMEAAMLALYGAL